MPVTSTALNLKGLFLLVFAAEQNFYTNVAPLSYTGGLIKGSILLVTT